jgi:hypothetical protein
MAAEALLPISGGIKAGQGLAWDTRHQHTHAGVYISVRKRYLFPPPLLKMIFFPPLATHCFSTPIVAFLLYFFPILLLFYPFTSSFLIFFPLSSLFIPLSSFFFYIFPLFLFDFSYFSPQMTSADTSPPPGGGYFPIYRPLHTLCTHITVAQPDSRQFIYPFSGTLMYFQ